MAISSPPKPQPLPSSGNSKLLRCAAFTLLGLVILLALSFVVIWLVIHPRHVTFIVEDARIYNCSLTHDHLNASFDLTIVVNNCNRHVSLYYDSTELSVRYMDHILAHGMIPPFYQGHRNVTRLYVKPVARDVQLSQAVSRSLRLKRTEGAVELDVQIRTRVRYKVGAWGSKDRTVKIFCSPVLGLFTVSKSFETTRCDVEL